MRRGRRGKENHDEIQLESDDVCQSGGNLVVNVDEKTDSALGKLTRLWPTLPAEVRTATLPLNQREFTGNSASASRDGVETAGGIAEITDPWLREVIQNWGLLSPGVRQAIAMMTSAASIST